MVKLASKLSANRHWDFRHIKKKVVKKLQTFNNNLPVIQSNSINSKYTPEFQIYRTPQKTTNSHSQHNRALNF